MTLFEIFVPKGLLNAERKRRLGDDLLKEVFDTNGSTADLRERARSLTQIMIHEPENWWVGSTAVDSASNRRYFVRVTVPGGHLSASMRAELVRRVTKVIGQVDSSPESLTTEPRIWIQVVEAADGSLGAFGRVVSTHDIIQMVVTPDWTPDNDDDFEAPTAVAHAIDPICNMTVVLDDHALTLEHDGSVYGFCSEGCRDIFARQHGLVPGQRSPAVQT